MRPAGGPSVINDGVSLLGGASRSGPVGVTGGEDDTIVTALYQAYRAPLMAFVLRLNGGDRQQAEDVVQETMVRAWREAADSTCPGSSLMPWLAAVARRIVIDEHRRKRARPARKPGGHGRATCPLTTTRRPPCCGSRWRTRCAS